MSQLLEQVPVAYISLAVLCALGLKKFVQTDKLHGLRVVILTMILWVAVLYLFGLAFPSSSCCVDCLRDKTDEPRAFCITET